MSFCEGAGCTQGVLQRILSTIPRMLWVTSVTVKSDLNLIPVGIGNAYRSTECRCLKVLMPRTVRDAFWNLDTHVAFHIIQAEGHTFVIVVPFVFLLALATAAEVELNYLETEAERELRDINSSFQYSRSMIAVLPMILVVRTCLFVCSVAGTIHSKAYYEKGGGRANSELKCYLHQDTITKQFWVEDY